MPELYEVLYTIPAYELDVVNDKVVRFRFWDADREWHYTETVQVSDIDFVGDYVIVAGYSEVLNDKDEWHLHESADVEVLGG